MTRFWMCALLLGLLVGACGSTDGPEPASVPALSWDQVDQADGETLYINLCASCHGAEGRGDGPTAAFLEIETPDLTGLSAANDGVFPIEWVEATIYGPDILALHGTPAMPIWGPALEGMFDDLPYLNRRAFAAHRIRKLARHLESLQVVE